MKLSSVITFFALSLSAFAAPAPEEPTTAAVAAPEAQATNSPIILKYTQRQSNNAWAIIKQIKAEKFGNNALTACKAAFATAITESNIYIYANKAVPESFKYPYDKIGKDHDSIGIYQQRAKYYKPAIAMSPAKSTHAFFTRMKTFKGWDKAKSNAAIGRLCQAVQVSSKWKEGFDPRWDVIRGFADFVVFHFLQSIRIGMRRMSPRLLRFARLVGLLDVVGLEDWTLVLSRVLDDDGDDDDRYDGKISVCEMCFVVLHWYAIFTAICFVASPAQSVDLVVLNTHPSMPLS